MLKRRIFGVLCACMMMVGLAGGMSTAAAAADEGYPLPEETLVYADTALLVNLGSDITRDTVLFSRAADEVRAPGSMMRFMVVAYTLDRVEKSGLDMDAVSGTYTVEMFNQYVAGTGVTPAHMKYGETWTLRDLLTVSFIHSASDALVTLAYALDGGVAEFVAGMNALAQEIGCDYSHFSNLTGLDSLSQYTTARDMYRIIRYGMTFAAFEPIVSTRQHTVKPLAGGDERVLISVNHMQQSSSQFYYSPLAFSRTGMSSHEGRTCASVARDSGYEYLVVVMSCPETNEAGESGLHYRDTRALFRWAFKRFEHATVLAKSEILASVGVRLSWSTDHINLVPEKEFATVVESGLEADRVIKRVTVFDQTVDAPVQKGDVLGKVELIINVDQKIGEVNLVASDSLKRNWLLFAISGLGGFFTSPWFWVGMVLLVLLIVGYIMLNISYNRRRRRERLQRVKR